MKPDNPIAHVGTLTGQKTRFQFDENSVAHLQSVLITLYEKPDEAVIREYSTNALDSHIEAGNPDPIDIYLPDPESLLNDYVFRVVDKGTGMSVDTITNFFSRYGASTKRNTDEQTGMMGLGCKAGLAYTSQMTVISCHEGVKTIALITREEDGGAALQVIDTSATNEPNGVEIIVPIKKPRLFNLKAREFFRFWDPGTVRINDEMVKSVWEDDHPDVLYKLDPDVVIVKGSGNDKIVMGSVPYTPPSGACWKFHGGYHDRYSGSTHAPFSVWCRVPIGTVHFTPAREGLNMESLKTKDTIAEINEFLRLNLTKTAENAIATEATALGAMRKASEMEPLIGHRRHLVKWNDLRIPSFSELVRGRRMTIRLKPSTWAKDRAEIRSGASYQTLLDAGLVVTGFEGKSIHAALKLKARIYAENMLPTEPAINNSNIEFLEIDKLPSPWLDSVRVVDIETIRAVVVPKEKKEEAEPRKKFRTITRQNAYQDTHDNYLPDHTVCWIEASDAWDTARTILPYLSSMAIIRKGEDGRRRRDYPDLPHFDLWLREQYIEHRKRVTRRLAFRMHSDETVIARLRRIPKGTVFADQELMEVMALCQSLEVEDKDENFWSRYETLYEERATVTLPMPDFRAMAQPLIDLVNRVFKRHPILRIVPSGYLDLEQIKEYIDERTIIQTGIHLHPLTY